MKVKQRELQDKSNSLVDLAKCRPFHEDSRNSFLPIISCAYQQMQVKTTTVAAISGSVDLNIHKGKS
ncbi:unnamed protein product [Schistosoma margrebowiei]|uniref:Uncharacterized protein n=1 Tax=Schistosoma margrebowiei TaxID=48269 RepID=A0A183MEG4_9TREM|nr:unnamed protein product [Schistosoma margrebowiei]